MKKLQKGEVARMEQIVDTTAAIREAVKEVRDGMNLVKAPLIAQEVSEMLSRDQEFMYNFAKQKLYFVVHRMVLEMMPSAPVFPVRYGKDGGDHGTPIYDMEFAKDLTSWGVGDKARFDD